MIVSKRLGAGLEVGMITSWRLMRTWTTLRPCSPRWLRTPRPCTRGWGCGRTPAAERKPWSSSHGCSRRSGSAGICNATKIVSGFWCLMPVVKKLCKMWQILQNRALKFGQNFHCCLTLKFSPSEIKPMAKRGVPFENYLVVTSRGELFKHASM